MPQDVLTDPPFSRASDLISCLNLRIYLQPETLRRRVTSRFDFALCEGGFLLLGSSEAVGDLDRHFAVVSKPERLYRHTPAVGGQGSLSMRRAPMTARASRCALGTARQPRARSVLADLCWWLAREMNAPAAVLIQSLKNERLDLGGTD